MKQRIAIEPDLGPVKDFLAGKGYQIENINYGQLSSSSRPNYDAYVVTGIDSNFLGMGDTNTKAIVIDASGLTPEQIYHELQTRL